MNTVVIVGVGILGIVAANEFLEKGYEVTVIDDPGIDYKKINSTGVKVNNSLIPIGLGGGSDIWSGLSSIITKEEWHKYRKFMNCSHITYSKILSYYKQALWYGFPEVNDSELKALDSQFKLKTFSKPLRLYDFKSLLINRDNLKILYGSVKEIHEFQKKSIIEVYIYDSCKEIKIKSDATIIACGGIGNFDLVSNGVLSNLKDDIGHSIIYGHPKAITSKIKLTNIGKIWCRKFDWVINNSFLTYQGVVCDFTKNSFGHYFQIIPTRWYETEGYVYFRNIIFYFIRSGIFKKKIKENIALICKNFNSDILIKFIKSLPSFFVAILLKLLRIKVEPNGAFVLTHVANRNPNNFISKVGSNIFINQNISNVERNELSVMFEDLAKYLKENEIGNMTKFDFSGILFEDSNHFMGTCAKFLNNSSGELIKGLVKKHNRTYIVGTSNLIFNPNINPTFTSLAFLFSTIENIEKINRD